MEAVLCKTSSAEVQKETVSLSVDREGPSDSKLLLLPTNISVEKRQEHYEEPKKVNGFIENGSETLINGGSPNKSETSMQKTYSPTLIGSAIQAVKNLFSPDKTKAKSVSVLNPINEQRSASGSPRSSIYFPGKTVILSSEPGMEILNSIQSASGENNLRNHMQMTEIGSIPSPLTFESPNNTDESFLTTVSLFDDSFHSAVTHLDEHGEAVKNGANFMDNLLNNSQNLDLSDPHNETLENNDSYLENTTLKLGSFSSEESKMCNVSILDADGNLNSTQDSGFLLENGSGKIEDDIPKGNNSSTPKEQLSRSSEGRPKKILQSPTVHPEKLNEAMQMAHIFLNKSFEGSTPPQHNETEMKSSNNLMAKEINLEVPNDEPEVEKSISTTTVVLTSASTVDLDVLSCLKSDDLESYIPSSGFFEGISSSEDDIALKHLKQLSGTLFYKQSTDSSSSPATNFSSLSQEKKCVSEGNSPTHGLNPIKVKLNKSDELINHRILSESPEGKRTFQEKNSSVDISLMKNSEASEITKESHNFEKVTKEHKSKIGENESLTNKPNTVAVFSQQSYTILNHDSSLNRPVIEPIKVSKELPEEQTFQALLSDGTLCGNLGKSNKNTSFSAEDLVKASQIKQSTPIWEGNNESAQKFFRPTSLKLNSPDGKQNCKENTSTRTEISPVNPVNDHLFDNNMNGSCSPFGFDPNSTRVLQLEELNKFKPSEEPNGASTAQKINQTFDKKSPKIGSEKMNQTFQKKSPSPVSQKQKQADPAGLKLNQTFEKISPKSKNLDSTFTKKRDSGEMEKANQTFDVPLSPETAQLNKTYDKPQLNETFDKKTDSLLNKTQVLEAAPRDGTFIKETENGCPTQELNKTFDKNGTECGTILKLEVGANKFTSEFYEKNDKNPGSSSNNESFSSGKSPNTSVLCSDLSTVVLTEEELHRNQSVDELTEKLEKIDLEGNPIGFDVAVAPLPEGISAELQTEEKLLNSLKDGKLGCDPDLVQLIQEQFSANDIEKICNVVQDFSSLKLSNDILKASEQFDKSFHGNLSDADFKPPEAVLKPEKPVTALSPQSLDFLNSIRGKPTGRDLSRESLYVKFDPLVQPSANSLIDFTKEGEALAASDAGSPGSPLSTSICEQLLAISPQKKPDDIVPPLTPLSHKVKTNLNEDKNERLKELQNEIYFLKNLYAERERSNKTKVEDYESQIAKLTSENCFLENKLKELNEREKCLVKKMKEQTDGIGQLKVIMEEYSKVISKLTGELETQKKENEKQVETLTSEKDSYMTHLQNTEAAFTDVHTKYEKSKKTILSLKTNEAMYRNTIAEQAQKLKEFKAEAMEAQEKALGKFQKIQEELAEMKSSHAQETARLRAQLRKTELKMEALQESLDQKIKENQQLTAICDELIEGKK